MKSDTLIKENDAILFVVKPEIYQDFIQQLTKDCLNKDISCYITLGRPFQSLSKSFEKNNLDLESIFFIDTSTKMMGNPPQVDNCLFIDSPSALTNLSIAVKKVVEASEPKYVLLDSLSTLLIYNPEQMIIKFTKDLINKMRVSNSKLILISLDGSDEANIIEKISMFVDKTQKITKMEEI